MLYFKMNAFNCDPLGEDPRTPEIRSRTAAAVEMADALLEQLVPLIGRRVDHFHTHYNRDWVEVPGVVLWGEKHFTVDEDEMQMLKAIDGRQTVGVIIASTNGTTERAGEAREGAAARAARGHRPGADELARTGRGATRKRDGRSDGWVGDKTERWLRGRTSAGGDGSQREGICMPLRRRRAGRRPPMLRPSGSRVVSCRCRKTACRRR